MSDYFLIILNAFAIGAVAPSMPTTKMWPAYVLVGFTLNLAFAVYRLLVPA